VAGFRDAACGAGPFLPQLAAASAIGIDVSVLTAVWVPTVALGKGQLDPSTVPDKRHWEKDLALR
jgi:hypothetical protein